MTTVCLIQDVVARGQKFLIYKRPGQRVLISSQGYMLVWRIMWPHSLPDPDRTLHRSMALVIVPYYSDTPYHIFGHFPPCAWVNTRGPLQRPHPGAKHHF